MAAANPPLRCPPVSAHPPAPVFFSALLASLADNDVCARHDRWVQDQLTGLKQQMMDIRRRKADAATASMDDDDIIDGISDPGEEEENEDAPATVASSSTSSTADSDPVLLRRLPAGSRSHGGGCSRG
jgi:hypothetical protein